MPHLCETAHIPGSYNVPLDLLREHHDELRNHRAPVTAGTPRWDLEGQVGLVAGSIVLLAVLASTLVEPIKWVAAFIVAGLTVAALTNTCAMGMLLAELPYNRGPRTDLDQVVTVLTSDRR